MPVPRRLLVALLATCAACGATDDIRRGGGVAEHDGRSCREHARRGAVDDRPATTIARSRLRPASPRGTYRRRRDPGGRSTAQQRGARHDHRRPRHRVRHRRDLRHRHGAGAGRPTSRRSAVRAREDHLVHRVERHRRGGRPQRRRHVALPAGSAVRPARAQRHPSARRTPVGRRHDAGGGVPARIGDRVGRPDVPVLRQLTPIPACAGRTATSGARTAGVRRRTPPATNTSSTCRNCPGPDDEWLAGVGGAYSNAAVIGANLDPISGDAPGEPPFAAAIFLHRHSYAAGRIDPRPQRVRLAVTSRTRATRCGRSTPR